LSAAVVVQSPAQARHLFLLFHGVGATPQDLVPLGGRLAREFPDAAIASIPGADRSELGGGFQWFSVSGVTEENRPARVAATLDVVPGLPHGIDRTAEDLLVQRLRQP
jgi:phospholipase/carboxylesterase